MVPQLSSTSDLTAPIAPDQLDHSIFISYSRRDPGAMNAVYCIVNALRFGVDEHKQPLCPATYLPGGKNDMYIWTDKEQLGDVVGQNWAEELTTAQKKAAMSFFMLSNAYFGSNECCRELYFGESKRLNYVPVTLEDHGLTAEQFEERKPRMKCDFDRNDFDSWESKRDTAQRMYLEKQGAHANLDLTQWTCSECVDTRDTICSTCTDWKNQHNDSMPKLLGMVKALARFIIPKSRAYGPQDESDEWKEGVRHAAAVVACISHGYKSTLVCQTVTNEARKLKKLIIPVLVEEDYQPDGWLAKLPGIASMTSLCCTSQTDFDMRISEVVVKLGIAGKRTKRVRQQSTAIAADRLAEVQEGRQSPTTSGTRSSRLLRKTVSRSSSMSTLLLDSKSLSSTKSPKVDKADPRSALSLLRKSDGASSPLSLSGTGSAAEPVASLPDISESTRSSSRKSPRRLNTADSISDGLPSPLAAQTTQSFSEMRTPALDETSEVVHRMYQAEKTSAVIQAHHTEKEAAQRMLDEMRMQVHEAKARASEAEHRKHDEFLAKLHAAELRAREAEARVSQLAESVASITRECHNKYELNQSQSQASVLSALREADADSHKQLMKSQSDLRALEERLAGAEREVKVLHSAGCALGAFAATTVAALVMGRH